MTIKNKRKIKEKARIVVVDLNHIPNNINLEDWAEHYKTTGMIITKQGILTKGEYEEKREDIK